MDVLMQDIRFALRALRRTPGYTAIVVAVMALGIGVNTMVFSMVYAVVYRPLPFHDANRLIRIEHFEPARGDDGNELSFMDVRDYRSQMKSIEGLGGWWDHNAFVTIDKDPERLYAATCTYDLFQTLGVKPILGRGFLPEEEQIGRNWGPVIVSNRIWTNRYHSDPKILGRSLHINGRVRTIVGVMPSGFLWPETQDFWIPAGFDPKEETRNAYALQTIARLKPGYTAAQANAEVAALQATVARDNPTTSKGVSSRALDFREAQSKDIRPMMFMLLGAVAFVLLIACANVANLMLARAAGRRREISLRLALGSSRGRVMRLLLTESVLVAIAGAFLGVLLAHWGNRLWIGTIPMEMPMWLDFSIDTPVMLFTAGVTVLSGILFGFAPALHASDARLNEALREGSMQSGSSRGGNRLRSALVVAEIALSLVLLVGAGLMIRSFMKRNELQNSLQTSGITTAAVLLPIASYPDLPSRTAFFHAVLPQIQALPGVSEATAASELPLGRDNHTTRILAEGTDAVDPLKAPSSNSTQVFPGYFHALGIPLRAGRDFSTQDTRSAPRVAIVNESMAHRLWPGKDPLGRRLRNTSDPDSIGWATVVGLVADVVANVEDATTLNGVYMPHDQDPGQWLTFIIRSTSPPAEVAARVRTIIQARDADLALVDVRSMTQHIQFSMWQPRLFTSLFGVFAVLALLIAGVGLYGVMAYSVAQRTQEIGLRMALGADQGAVVGMVVGQAMRLTILGSGIGLAAAYAVTRVMASVLFQVSPNDPPTFVGVAMLLALSAIVAAWLPARRATRVDPMVALRCE